MWIRFMPPSFDERTPVPERSFSFPQDIGEFSRGIEKFRVFLIAWVVKDRFEKEFEGLLGVPMVCIEKILPIQNLQTFT